MVTVLNEESGITQLLESLTTQSLLPLEIIVVDGGSTDETLSILKKYSLKHSTVKVFRKPGNRSVGRNFGVSRTKSPLIAFTDAGCIPDPDWLKKLSQPFSDSKIAIVSGYYRGLSQNIFQKCLVPYVLVMPDKADKSEFYPATRSMALRRDVWNKSAGFNPALSHNEDYAFADHLKKLGYSFHFAQDAVVSWLPRKNFKSASWMFTRFAIGDIQAGIYRPKVKLLAIRYLIFLFIIFLAFELPELFWLIGCLVIIYLTWSITKNYRYVKDIRAFYWLPVIQVTADISVLFGTLVGLLSK